MSAAGGRRILLRGRTGGALTERVAAGLRALGHTVSVDAGRVPGPEDPASGEVSVDLLIERSPDGWSPPAERSAEDGGHTSECSIVVSSTFAYLPSERHIGLAPEDWGPAPAGSVARAWRDVEERALARGSSVLRAAPVAMRDGHDVFSRWLDRRLAPSAFGFDPPLQLLHPDDLVSAIAHALEGGFDAARTINLVPRRPVFLRRAVSLARRRPGLRVAVPTLLLRRLGLGAAADLWRYPFTARGERATSHGWTASHTSRDAARALRRPDPRPARDRSAVSLPVEPGESEPIDDPFGMDKAYIGRFEATLFRVLHDVYWRIDTEGLEHLPRHGGALLVGVHRGFMPWDGVMMLVTARRHVGRFIRFLIHPGLIRMPVLTPYMNKLGGVVACRENADWMLSRGRLVGVFPEGIRGAFRLYRDWHRVGLRPGRIGSDEFVSLALRHDVPLVPFVTVGSAEIFPIWGKIEWSWWRRVAEWPFVPWTTPVPLPSKWHTCILPPIDLNERAQALGFADGPAAAEDRDLVRALSAEVQALLQATLDDLRQRRRRLFWGRLEPAP
ncbi:MAG: 1-acyl-sn-glycerol-3-phosphate acyltransferase [Acidobacteriota bacterium]